jgi:DNA repair exonuclease SbcCD ATPase subunit
MPEIKTIRKKLEQQKGQRQILLQQIARYQKEITELTEKRDNLEQARELIREAGLRTQQQLQYHISDITSLALSAVFEDPYELKVDFVQRRNKTECDLIFVRDGKEIDPLEASGYGAVDVASFALRVASWSMQQPRTRNVIILDEPMRFLSEDRQPYAGKMVKELSERLGLQFIIVTHEEVFSQYADKVFQVSMKDKVSQIKVLGNDNH